MISTQILHHVRHRILVMYRGMGIHKSLKQCGCTQVTGDHLMIQPIVLFSELFCVHMASDAVSKCRFSWH